MLLEVEVAVRKEEPGAEAKESLCQSEAADGTGGDGAAGGEREDEALAPGEGASGRLWLGGGLLHLDLRRGLCGCGCWRRVLRPLLAHQQGGGGGGEVKRGS